MAVLKMANLKKHYLKCRSDEMWINLNILNFGILLFYSTLTRDISFIGRLRK